MQSAPCRGILATMRMLAAILRSIILLRVSTYIVWWELFIENNQLSIVATISDSIRISWLRDPEDVTQIGPTILICWNDRWLVNHLVLCLRQTTYRVSGTTHPTLDFRKSKYFCSNDPFKDHGFERVAYNWSLASKEIWWRSKMVFGRIEFPLRS